MNKIISIILITILLTLTAGCSLLKKPGAAEETGTTEETPAAEESNNIQNAVIKLKPQILKPKTFTVSGAEFSFNPNSITVKRSEKVKIIFKNTGNASHNLVIEKLNIKTKTINSGASTTLEFTAKTSGTYKFFCSIPGHRAAGMEGNLKVQ